MSALPNDCDALTEAEAALVRARHDLRVAGRWSAAHDVEQALQLVRQVRDDPAEGQSRNRPLRSS